MLPSTIAEIVHPRESQHNDLNMLRLYGLLTTEQKSKMASNGHPMGSLTTEELEYLDRMVYGPNAFLQYTPKRNPQGTLEQVDWDLYSEGLLHEATEALPDGVPPQALVTLEKSSAKVVITSDITTADLTTPGHTFDARGLAWQKFAQDRPDLFNPNTLVQRADFSKLILGERLCLDFSFEFNSSFSLNRRFEDKSLGGFKKTTLDDLPDDFKKQFQRLYANYASSYANAKSARSGVNSVPPPR